MYQTFYEVRFLKDGSDAYIYTGFPCDHIKITNITSMDYIEWFRLGGALSGHSRDASTPDFTLETDAGIRLVRFGTDDQSELTAVPAIVDSTGAALDMNTYQEADGFLLDGDWSELADANAYLVEAWPVRSPVFKITHDGGTSQLFVQDDSYDLQKLGVGQGWIVFNSSLDTLAYVKEVVKPDGVTKYSRAMLSTDRAGLNATTAAGSTDGNVIYLMPYPNVYPMSAIGLMT